MNEESLFVAALDKTSTSEREAFLEAQCAGDVALRHRVEQLLAAHLRTLGILDRSARPSSWTDVADASAPGGATVGEGVGTLIADRYRLLEVVGAGGMGKVWKAEQTQPVRRTVALKLIRAGTDSRTLLARFEAERQALALMDHPNIAKVLDGGTTESGRPFFVMEYVQGVPLTRYCDDARLTIAERLALFVQVCQAVQHAHTKGVIHRDLKPSNILVCLSDGRPVPKVIDFGLAKAINQPLTDRTLQTVHGVMLGTPLYMSPEQAGLKNLDVDARTDVYALGVILYELLTGTTPLERERFHEAGWLELLRLIKEEEPPRPSARLSDCDSLPSVAAQRQLEPVRLTRLVRGELDWIVMKCLEKDRSRRYETANGLARDVQRYLSDESVEACPPSAGYLLRKFVRRNKGPMLAASIISLLLVGGIVGTTWGLIRADRAREAEAKRAEGEREARAQAQKRLQQIEKGTEILAAVFNDLDPRSEEKEGKPLRAILGDRLTQAAEQLEGEGVGDPLLVAKLQNRLGVSLVRLGLARRAIPLHEKARAVRAAGLGADDPATLEIMINLARAYEAAGEPDKALPLFEENLKLMKVKPGADHPDTFAVMDNLAGSYLDAGKPGPALALYEETLRLRQAGLSVDHPDTLTTMNNLALCYTATFKLDLALPLLKETLALRKARLGADHVDTLNSMNSLAEGYRAAGDLDQAIPLWEETLKVRKAKLGLDHPDTLSVMNNLATGYKTANKLDQAIPLLEETFKLTKAKRGLDHPATIISMNNLATGYSSARKPDRALPLLEELLTLVRGKHGPHHPHTISVMNNLAMAYRAARKSDKALPLLEQTLELRKDYQGVDHPDTLRTMNNLASGYRAADKLDRAIPLWEQALRLSRMRLGSDHSDTLTSMNNLASGYKAGKQPEKALALFNEAAIAVEKRRFRHEFVAKIVDNLVFTLEDLKQFGEAEIWRRKWLAFVKESSGADSLPYAGALELLGANLLQQEKWTDAESLLTQALALRERKEPDAWTTHGTRSRLGYALLGQNYYAEAESLLILGYEEIKAREKQIPRPDQYRVAEAGEWIVRLYDSWNRAEEAAEWRMRLARPVEAKPEP
jgi:serine/threonine protein kinase/tetratricopeptide (TPR) repeat protein